MTLDDSYEEAVEVCQDAEGRWFSFTCSKGTLFILESKNIASHLANMETLDTAIRLEALISDLQDLGEAGNHPKKCRSASRD